jgi:hypothetical protein
MNIENSSQPAVTLNNILEAYFPFLVPLSPSSAECVLPRPFDAAESSTPAPASLESAALR